MRAKAAQLGALLLCAVALAAANDPPLNALKEQARREGQPRLYAEVVRRQVEVANDLYTAGEVEKAEATINEIVSFADKCLESAQARKGRNLKSTELTLYKAGRRLEEVRRSLNFDDQPKVKTAVDAIEKARRGLLAIMFTKKDKKTEDKPEEKPEESRQ